MKPILELLDRILPTPAQPQHNDLRAIASHPIPHLDSKWQTRRFQLLQVVDRFSPPLADPAENRIECPADAVSPNHPPARPPPKRSAQSHAALGLSLSAYTREPPEVLWARPLHTQLALLTTAPATPTGSHPAGQSQRHIAYREGHSKPSRCAAK